MAEMNKRDALQGMTVNDRGSWSYDDAASSGHIEIELPTLPGSPNPTERLHAREFGPHVAAKIESSMNQQPYLRDPRQNAPAIFRHYVGAAKGYGLMDGGAISRMETLAKEFESEPEQVVKPYLHSLTPKRRQQP